MKVIRARVVCTCCHDAEHSTDTDEAYQIGPLALDTARRVPPRRASGNGASAFAGRTATLLASHDRFKSTTTSRLDPPYTSSATFLTRGRTAATLRDICTQVDAVVIVDNRPLGTVRPLIRACHRCATPALGVQRADQLDPAWFADCRRVALVQTDRATDEAVEQVHHTLLSFKPTRPSWW